MEFEDTMECRQAVLPERLHQGRTYALGGSVHRGLLLQARSHKVTVKLKDVQNMIRHDSGSVLQLRNELFQHLDNFGIYKCIRGSMTALRHRVQSRPLPHSVACGTPPIIFRGELIRRVVACTL